MMARRPRRKAPEMDPLGLVAGELDPQMFAEWDMLSEDEQRAMLADVRAWSVEQVKDARTHYWLSCPEDKELRPCLAWAAASVGVWSP